MKNTAKKFIAMVLTLALVAALGVSAFADGPSKPSGHKQNKSVSSPAPVTDDVNDKQEPTDDTEDINVEDEDMDDWDYDSYFDDAFTFDMTEVFNRIKDDATREQVEKLYDEYLAAFDEEQAAEKKLCDAEDAFFEALNNAEMEDDTANDSNMPTDEEIEDTLDDLEKLSFDDLLKIFTEFISWYNSTAKPTIDQSTVS